MHTLMAATDLSSRSGKALHQAMLIALQCEARLVILHVVDERQPTELADRRISEVKTFLNASAADIGRLNGLEVDVIVRCGIPHLVIAETAREQAVDLIVMGAHQKDAWRDLFSNTTIERVLRGGVAPVLLVNEDPVPLYRRVLFAIDAANPSARTAYAARNLPFLEAADISVLHAFWAPGKGKLRQAGVNPARIAQYVEETALEAATDLVSFLHQEGRHDPVEKIVFTEGEPVSAIREATARWRSQLAVIGIQRRTGLRRLLCPSSAKQILRQVSCDILAVPLKDSSSAGRDPAAPDRLRVWPYP